MRHAGRVDDPHLVAADRVAGRRRRTAEHRRPTQHRHDVQLHLVDQAGGEELPGDVRAAADGHPPVPGRRRGELQRLRGPVRDEDEVDRPAAATGGGGRCVTTTCVTS